MSTRRKVPEAGHTASNAVAAFEAVAPVPQVRPGQLALADDGRTIELHYESLEVAVLLNGEEVVQSTKQGIKRIKYELDASDLYGTAQSIVQGCRLLHAGRVEEVALLLEEAQQLRRQGGEEARTPPSGTCSLSLRETGSSLAAPHQVSEIDRQRLHEEQQQYLQAAAASATQALAAAAGSARLSCIDEYLEALYEEDQGPKTAAAAAIALLLRDPAILGVLAAHPTLLQALARLLREDAKKSSELCKCLLMAFFALSHLPHAHSLLVQNQVGSLTMDLLDLELRRAELWQQQEGVAAADVGARLLRHDPLQPQEQRLALALARQEPLVYVGISLLLSMAEDAAVEQKMVKKGLLTLLVALLSRGSARLLVLATTFLRKLSVAADNRAELRELEVVGQLAALLPGQPSAGGTADEGGAARQLLSSVLRLLHNLSLDGGMRQQMVAAGVIGKVAGLLELECDDLPTGTGSNMDSSSAGASDVQLASSVEQPNAGALQSQAEPSSLPQGQQRDQQRHLHDGPTLSTLVLGLLYHLSLHDRHRSMFLYTDAIPRLHAMLLRAPSPLASTSPELAALVVSLAGSARVAEEMARFGRLEQLLRLVLGPCDAAPQLLARAATIASHATADSQPEEAGAAAAGTAAAGDSQQEMQPQEVAACGPQRSAWGPAWNDEVLWKLLRSMAQHESEPLRLRFSPALAHMAALITAGSLPQPAFAAALGCLAWLDIPGFDYAQLLAATQLHTYLAQLAARGGADEEQGWAGLQLDLVHALGVLCACEASAELLVAAGLVEVLHSFILEGAEDEEALLAATVAAARFMAQRPTRAGLLAHAELAAHFAELLRHRWRGVARAADTALDAIASASEEWRTSVQRLKFEAYNREWLQVVLQLDAAAPQQGFQEQAAGLGSPYSQAAAGSRQQLMQAASS